MPKAYLRYQESDVFGIIASPETNISYDKTGKLAIAGALESCIAWQIRGGNKVHRCKAPLLTHGQGGKALHELASSTKILLSPDGKSVAVGFVSGDIRTFALAKEECEQLLCFRGHRRAISSLAYDRNGSLLASGSDDCEIVVWDITSEQGLYRLRGHRGVVTDLKFMYHLPTATTTTNMNGNNDNLIIGPNDQPKYLVSSSKDTFIKFWDLNDQFCVDTIVGHRSEVWSFDINANETKMVTLSNTAEFKVWDITKKDNKKQNEDSNNNNNNNNNNDDDDDETENIKMATLLSIVKRQGRERGMTIRYSNDGTLLGVQGAGKILEIFRVRNEIEIEKKIARRKKRQREKNKNKDNNNMQSNENVNKYVGTDEFALATVVRSHSKLRSFAFSPTSTAKSEGSGGKCDVLLLLQNNVIEQYNVDLSDRKLTKQGVARNELSCTLEQHGHRSDIRAVAINKADDMVASVGKKRLKIWNIRSQKCIISAEINYGLCVAFIPGDTHVLVGTKKGTLSLFSLSTGDCVQEVLDAHDGSIWSIDIKPDGMGFCSGGADHQVKFWKFGVTKETKEPRFKASRTLQLADDVLSVKYSHTQDSQKLLVCAALLDSTVKVFFDDSLKFFLSLYGHRLPVLCLDVCTDNTLCITGSADKNVKIWGLDFGDCHKSMFLHNDSIMSLAFVPKTHMFFSSSKDGTIKMVDADVFEEILTLRGHHGDVWGLAVSHLGDYLVSVSGDRSLRMWQRSTEQVFLEEEKERELNRKIEEDLNRSSSGVHGIGALTNEESAKKANEGLGIVTLDSAAAGQRTVGTVKAGERLLDVLEMIVQEENTYQQYLKLVAQAEENLSSEEVTKRKKLQENGEEVPVLVEPPKANILLLGRTILQHLLHTLRSIRPSELEEALLVLPFEGVKHLIGFLSEMIQKEMQIELVGRVLFFVLRLHHRQIVANHSLRDHIEGLKDLVRKQLEEHRNVLGFNIAGLKHVKRVVAEKYVRIDDGTTDGSANKRPKLF